MRGVKIGLVIFIFGIFVPVLGALFLRMAMGSIEPKHHKTLNDLYNYSLSLNENRESDVNNWEDPNYISYYKERNYSFGNLFRIIANLKNTTPNNPKFLISLLKELTKRHNNYGFKSNNTEQVTYIKGNK